MRRVLGHAPMSAAHTTHSKASTRSTKKNPKVSMPKQGTMQKLTSLLRAVFLAGRWDDPAQVLPLPLTSHQSPYPVSEAPGAQEPTHICWTQRHSHSRANMRQVQVLTRPPSLKEWSVWKEFAAC